MEEIKNRMQKRLNLLENIKKPKLTAMQLHTSKNHLLQRVKRKEEANYNKKILAQKKSLRRDLSLIDIYENKFRLELKKRESRLANYDPSLGLPPPTFLPIDQVVIKPRVSIQSMPNLIKTRLANKSRLRRIR